jgi:hypothetical protein
MKAFTSMNTPWVAAYAGGYAMNWVRLLRIGTEAFWLVSGVLTVEPPVGIEPTTYSLRAAASGRWPRAMSDGPAR